MIPKFRAWDKVLKKMYEVYTVGIYKKELEVACGNSWKRVYMSECELMQSTGSRIVEKAKGFICDITRDVTKNYRLRKNV